MKTLETLIIDHPEWDVEIRKTTALLFVSASCIGADGKVVSFHDSVGVDALVYGARDLLIHNCVSCVERELRELTIGGSDGKADT